jgi:hypothetical protein
MEITLVRNGREHAVRLRPDWLQAAKSTVAQMRVLQPPAPFRNHGQAIRASIASILDGHYPDPDRKLLASHVAGWVVSTGATEGVYLVSGKAEDGSVEITAMPSANAQGPSSGQA